MTRKRFISKSAEILDTRKTNDNYSFEQWMMFLNAEFLNIGFNRKPFTDEADTSSNSSCWFDQYEFGNTPFEAIEEDFS